MNSLYNANHYNKYDMIINKSYGCYVYSGEKAYFDCLSAYSAANQGHHHPYIVNVMIDALKNHGGSVISNIVDSNFSIKFIEKVSKLIPQLAYNSESTTNKVLIKNSGVESVETAIKAMRFYGYKHKKIQDGEQEIIVFKNNFHGRTISVISFSSTKKYSEGFGPLTFGFKIVPYNDLKAVENVINKNTCGILVEPMQGEGGMRIPDDGYLKGLRLLADKHDLMLVFDEIQVGLGRSGKMFCFEHENVIPDGLILGKAITGGLLPLSVFVTGDKIMDMVFTPGKDGSTYGGYPLACVVGIAALDVIINENLPEKAKIQGQKLLYKLKNVCGKSKYVKEIRGKGLFIGIELIKNNAMEFCMELLDRGILANDSHGNVIRISPPLIINDEQINFIVKKMGEVLGNENG